MEVEGDSMRVLLPEAVNTLAEAQRSPYSGDVETSTSECAFTTSASAPLEGLSPVVERRDGKFVAGQRVPSVSLLKPWTSIFPAPPGSFLKALRVRACGAEPCYL
jgi:hypothetical protein